MKQAQWMMETKMGRLYLVASSEGLKETSWKKRSVPMAPSLKSSDREIQILAQAVEQLQEYFAGQRTDFDLPLDLQGTDFQKKVWKELSRIPFGRTCSYGDLARKIKNERAVRAVGTANGKNPICVIVPCHRVVAADGTLGGYSGGLDFKVQLLALEGHGELKRTPSLHSKSGKTRKKTK